MQSSKQRPFARQQPFLKRLILMILGVTVQGFGLSILRSINLGVDPCSCLTQGVANHIPMSFGTCQLLCHLVTFIFVIRYDMSYIGFGTVGNMCFLGYISDFFTWIWKLVLPTGFFATVSVRYCMLLPGLAGLLFGAAAYMCSGLGSSPYDAMPFIISNKTKKLSFRMVRMLWDIAFMAAGFALGGSVGIVTVAVAFFCGPIVAWMQKKLTKWLGIA